MRSFERFLSFLGLARDEQRIGPGPDFERRSGVFTSPNHNWLRITRVLTSLRLLGLEADSQAFFACLQDLVKNGQAKVSQRHDGLLAKRDVPRPPHAEVTEERQPP